MEVRVEGRIKLVDEEGRALSWVEYEVEPGGNAIHLIATFTAKGEEGKGYASRVVGEALSFAEKFRKIKVSCPFIKRWIEKRGGAGHSGIEYTNLLRFNESIEKFNRYHSPEATAEYLRHEKDRVYVKFYGPFCRSCGIYDYFEDVLVDVVEGMEAEIESFQELDDEDGFLVVYRVKGGLY